MFFEIEGGMGGATVCFGQTPLLRRAAEHVLTSAIGCNSNLNGQAHLPMCWNILEQDLVYCWLACWSACAPS